MDKRGKVMSPVWQYFGYPNLQFCIFKTKKLINNYHRYEALISYVFQPYCPLLSIEVLTIKSENAQRCKKRPKREQCFL